MAAAEAEHRADGVKPLRAILRAARRRSLATATPYRQLLHVLKLVRCRPECSGSNSDLDMRLLMLRSCLNIIDQQCSKAVHCARDMFAHRPVTLANLAQAGKQPSLVGGVDKEWSAVVQPLPLAVMRLH